MKRFGAHLMSFGVLFIMVYLILILPEETARLWVVMAMEAVTLIWNAVDDILIAWAKNN